MLGIMGLNRRQFFTRLWTPGNEPKTPADSPAQLPSTPRQRPAPDPRLQEIRAAAPDFVASFLTSDEEQVAVSQFKEIYGISDPSELENMLKDQMRMWISEADDRLISQYDTTSVRDLVFAQLRSWC